MSKSRPVYAPLALDATGAAHLVVSEFPVLAEARALLAAGAEVWLNGAPLERPAATGNFRKFRAVADLLANLRHRLGRAVVGVRLYAVGTEAFLWDVHNLGVGAGLGRDEILLVQRGSLRRRVFCAHCKTINEDVTTSIVACRDCGAKLFVRDHFSRRLAAFMGVAVDAEAPGDVPPARAVFR